MQKITIKDLAQITGAKLNHQSDGYFKSVNTDSRTIQPGQCFFAIAGENFDGHDYLDRAFEKGAACAVISREKKSLNSNCLLKVPDTTQALGRLAAEYRNRANFKVVAITGSVGKTTTRQIVAHVLSQKYKVFQSPKNFNNQIGLPLTLLQAEPDCQIVIAEIGANQKGEVSYLSKIAQPNIAMVTNVHPAHLAGFKDIKTIAKEKLSIADGLQPGGKFFINGICDILTELCDSDAEDFTPLPIDKKHLPPTLPGPGNIENAKAAWAICKEFKITLDEFSKALTTLPAVAMRAEIINTSAITIINDCYNANPASMKNAIDILTDLRSEKKSRAVFICGEMAELGQHTDQLHRQLGHQIAEAKIDLLITVGKSAEITANTAEKQADYDLQIKCFENTASACNNLKEIIKPCDIILVKGSRSARLELVVEKLKEFFP